MRFPSPKAFQVFVSAARTATTSSNAYFNDEGYRGVRLYINFSAVSGTGSNVISIQVKDPITGTWKNLTGAVSAAIVAPTTGPTLLEVYPGCIAVANEVVNRAIGKQFRVTSTAGTADAMTFSVAAEWLT